MSYAHRPSTRTGGTPSSYVPQQAYKQGYAYQTPTRVPPSGAPNYRPQAAIPSGPYVYPDYPSGPLGFFLPPPNQQTMDPSMPTPRTQAKWTSYPSRLRTGATSLVQPENVTGGSREREAYLAELDKEIAGARSSGTSTPRIDSPAPGRASRTTTTTMSGRRAGRVNYAEAEESEDEEESSEEEVEQASDPEDDNYGERRRRRDKEADRAANHIRIRKKQAEAEPGWSWLGDRVPAERVHGLPRKITDHKYMPEEVLAAEAERPELLVPISLDFDIPAANGDSEGIKIKDRFLWNANEPFYRPLEFGKILCRDIGIPEAPYANTIADLIQAQLEDAQNTVAIDLATEDATPDDVAWSDDDANDAMEVDERGEHKWVEPDCRIVINLDVQIFTHVLRDRIEWDLSSPLPPSEFARHYCAELGLTGEAIPLIAHAIHEELIKHKRDALELDLFAQTHPQEQAKWEKSGPGGLPRTNYRTGARGLVGVWRDWWERDEFGPILIELTADDMDKRETERSREARRLMRTLQTSKRSAGRIRYY